MRRLLPAIVLVLAACGGGDDSATPAAASSPASSPATATTPLSEPSTPTAPVESDECEIEPDPADYVAGVVPTALRPCEIPTALQIHPLRSGTGRNAQDGDTMIVDYVGIRAEDGTIFDESYSRGVPIEFPLGRGGVIPGWDDGLLGTQAGAVVKLDIPGELAYGDTPPGGADGDIQPGDALTFVVEVRSVIAAVTADDAPLDLDIEPSVGATEVTVTELVEGDGAVAELGDTVVVHLLLIRGDNEVVLFNTWENADPFQIILEDGQTLPGLFEALPGAGVGSTLAVVMPPEQAFGEQGESSIGLPAGVDVIAIVEVLGLY